MYIPPDGWEVCHEKRFAGFFSSESILSVVNLYSASTHISAVRKHTGQGRTMVDFGQDHEVTGGLSRVPVLKYKLRLSMSSYSGMGTPKLIPSLADIGISLVFSNFIPNQKSSKDDNNN